VDEALDYHFTYGPPDLDLCQGDLLRKTDAVQALLQDVHPHYAKEDYSHLLVLTQSCDLVRRAGECGARYVSLAAVRPLSLILERKIDEFQDPFAKEAGVCAKGGSQSSIKRKLQELLGRLLNNNEPEFFYLEPDRDRGLTEPSCAFLQLSIAVRARQHYATLLEARMLALSPVFQAKLGWLVGHMYSRVGTPDWVTPPYTRSQFDKRVDTILGEVTRWVDDDRLELARERRPENATREELQKHIQQVAVPKRKDLVLDAVMTVVQRAELVAAEDAEGFRLLLSNDPVLSSLLRG
jgi:hypothetical protein